MREKKQNIRMRECYRLAMRMYRMSFAKLNAIRQTRVVAIVDMKLRSKK